MGCAFIFIPYNKSQDLNPVIKATLLSPMNPTDPELIWKRKKCSNLSISGSVTPVDTFQKD